MALFRAGHDEAFRAIHDRYRQRLFAYTRQMLPARQDAEDALQDVFVRAYSGLRASHGRLVLRAWLYRIAHNRCIDELRRPAPPPPEVLELVRAPADDPIAAADQRESLRRLVIDVRRLPEQQRSALLMRELSGMAYADMADALGVSVPAVKSLLVRARIALAKALEARDTACSDIRGQLTLAHDRGVRPSGTARRHMRDCSQCRHFHGELRGVSRRFAALAPTVGPMGVIAKVLGLGSAGGGGAAASSGAIAAGGAAGTGGAVASVGLFATGAGHIATLIAAAAVTAGGAVEIQSSIAMPGHHAHHARAAATAPAPTRGARADRRDLPRHRHCDVRARRRDRSRAPDRNRHVARDSQARASPPSDSCGPHHGPGHANTPQHDHGQHRQLRHGPGHDRHERAGHLARRERHLIQRHVLDDRRDDRSGRRARPIEHDRPVDRQHERADPAAVVSSQTSSSAPTTGPATTTSTAPSSTSSSPGTETALDGAATPVHRPVGRARRWHGRDPASKTVTLHPERLAQRGALGALLSVTGRSHRHRLAH